MSKYPELRAEDLAQLRSAVREIQHGDRAAVPIRKLVELAGTTSLGAGITIDFAAAEELGQPLIVLRMGDASGNDPCFASVSDREREVIRLIADGLSNKDIARRLFISLATVKDHVHRILAKTGLPNRTAVATAWNGRRSASG
jgi:DNA-binding NarL/FixJ family response regulator